ncbi:MAG: hypothetical protein AAGB46_06850 [Verrucomicrobiota bacterium]
MKFLLRQEPLYQLNARKPKSLPQNADSHVLPKKGEYKANEL